MRSETRRILARLDCETDNGTLGDSSDNGCKIGDGKKRLLSGRRYRLGESPEWLYWRLSPNAQRQRRCLGNRCTWKLDDPLPIGAPEALSLTQRLDINAQETQVEREEWELPAVDDVVVVAVRSLLEQSLLIERF